MRNIGPLTDEIVALNKEIDAALDKLLISEKCLGGIERDLDILSPPCTPSPDPATDGRGLPIVSVGPSGIGGQYNKEYFG